MNISYWWIILLSIIPALLATILVFLDQQITSVIVNRKEHKLQVIDLLLTVSYVVLFYDSLYLALRARLLNYEPPCIMISFGPLEQLF
jgi:ABC-type spermidine/putrescine transport system permease subunit I